jgi:hypothetical protein
MKLEAVFLPTSLIHNRIFARDREIYVRGRGEGEREKEREREKRSRERERSEYNGIRRELVE